MNGVFDGLNGSTIHFEFDNELMLLKLTRSLISTRWTGILGHCNNPKELIQIKIKEMNALLLLVTLKTRKIPVLLNVESATFSLALF